MGQVLLWCLIFVALPAAMLALAWALFWSPQHPDTDTKRRG